MAGDGIILIGGGGHAMMVAEAAILGDSLVAGFLCDRPRPQLQLSAGKVAPHRGGLRNVSLLSQFPWIVAVGDLQLREELINGVPASAQAAAQVLHPQAIVSASARIGEGVFAGPGAIVNPGAQVGAHAILNSGAIVEHHCRVGVNAHIAPGAVLGGAAEVGDHVLVGIGAAVLPNVRVGARATVGAGAVVVSEVPEGATVVGVPARRIG